MVFSILEYLFSFLRYSSFCSKIDDVINFTITVINHKIKNISENIGWVLFKLGSGNLRQARHKMISRNCINYCDVTEQDLCQVFVHFPSSRFSLGGRVRLHVG